MKKFLAAAALTVLAAAPAFAQNAPAGNTAPGANAPAATQPAAKAPTKKSSMKKPTSKKVSSRNLKSRKASAKGKWTGHHVKATNKSGKKMHNGKTSTTGTTNTPSGTK